MYFIDLSKHEYKKKSLGGNHPPLQNTCHFFARLLHAKKGHATRRNLLTAGERRKRKHIFNIDFAKRNVKFYYTSPTSPESTKLRMALVMRMLQKLGPHMEQKWLDFAWFPGKVLS